MFSKDGVSAFVRMGEFIAFLDEKKMNLTDQLEMIYKT